MASGTTKPNSLLSPRNDLSDLKDKEKQESSKTQGGWNWFCTCRFQISLLLCYGYLCSGFFRVSIYMALVCMVNNTATLQFLNGKWINSENGSSFFDPQPNFPEKSNNISREGCVLSEEQREEYDGDLLWTDYEDKWIRSSIMYGQIISTIPAGWLSDRYGPKILFQICITVQMLCSMMTPFGARFYYICAFLLRFVTGLAQGLMLPAAAATITRWFPPDEMSTVTAIYTAGNQLCMIIGLPLFAFLCSEHQLMGGWPAIFYFCSIIAIPWCVWWQLTVTNSPAVNKRVPVAEKQYLEFAQRGQSLRKRKGSKLPWKHMLTSVPVWSLNVMSFATGFTLYIQQYLPRYFKDVLYLDIRSNGLYSALPFVTQWLVKYVLSYYADQVKRRTILSRSTICKLFNSFAAFGMALILVLIAFLDCHKWILAIAMLCLGQAFCAGFSPGSATTAHLLAPHYAGTINSFAFMFAHVAGVMVPYIISPLIKNSTREDWQFVFILGAAVLAAGGLQFLFFGSAEIQDWARTPEPVVTDELANELLANGHVTHQKEDYVSAVCEDDLPKNQ